MSDDSRTLAGISQIEMACSLKVTLDRMTMTWDNLAAYMDALNQIVPSHAAISFTDQGDSVLLQFIWSESREVEYRVGRVKVGTRQTPPEPRETTARREGVAALPRKG